MQQQTPPLRFHQVQTREQVQPLLLHWQLGAKQRLRRTRVTGWHKGSLVVQPPQLVRRHELEEAQAAEQGERQAGLLPLGRQEVLLQAR